MARHCGAPTGSYDPAELEAEARGMGLTPIAAIAKFSW